MDGLDSGTLTVKVDFVKGHVVLALAQSLSELARAAVEFSSSFRILAVGLGLGASLWGAGQLVGALRGRREERK